MPSRSLVSPGQGPRLTRERCQNGIRGGFACDHRVTTVLEPQVGPATGTPSDLLVCCALGGTRTPNLLIRSQMLYPIELRARGLGRTTLGDRLRLRRLGWG